MTLDPFDTYARLDPARDVDPDWERIGTLVVDTIDERTRSMTLQLDSTDTQRPDRGAGGDRPNRRSALLLAAAASLIAIGIVAVILTVRDDGEEVPADDPPVTITTVAPPADVERTLAEHERPYVGGWAATVDDGEGGWAFDLALSSDLTLVAATSDGPCDIEARWSVTADDPTFTAEGTCGDGSAALIATARPERIDGTVTIDDGVPQPFTAVYEPSTPGRALTDDELGHVGLWHTPATEAPDQPSLLLRDDGTFQLLANESGDASGTLSEPIDGYWEITSADVFTMVGPDAGVVIRIWGPADPVEIAAQSSSGADVPLTRIPTRSVAEHELAYVGDWGSWAYEMTLNPDGTYATTPVDEGAERVGCDGVGVWSVEPDGSSFVGTGICGDEPQDIRSIGAVDPAQFNANVLVPSEFPTEVTMIHR